MPKLFWPFTVCINCSSDLKIFANSRRSVTNFKSFSWSLFFLTVDQNNFGNKIPFLKWKWAVLSHFLFCTFRLPVQSFIKLLIVRTENRTKGSKIELPLIRKIQESFWILHKISNWNLSEKYYAKTNYFCNVRNHQSWEVFGLQMNLASFLQC
jgi:hypothetical protein